MTTEDIIGSTRDFDTEDPKCPFRDCDMRSNHQKVGAGWDFEYRTTLEEVDYIQCQYCKLIFPHEIPSESALPVIYPSCVQWSSGMFIVGSK